MKFRVSKISFSIIAVASILFISQAAYATDVYLKAQAFDKDLSTGTSPLTVPMWGFVSCDATFATCDPVADAPGPQITLNLAAGDTTLNIYVMNTLPMPVSIVIPGLGSAGNPVMMNDGLGRQRVQSFTHEALPGATSPMLYSWSNLRAGTYLYQSGTYPSIQVPMGLYGALVINPDPVDPGYSSDAVLFFSEVDPLQNLRVADAADAGLSPTTACTSLASYAASPITDYPCTIDYNPLYLLLNGKLTEEQAIGDPGNVARLRFLNAGLRPHTPSIVGLEMDLIAEDGNNYPGLPRQQNTVLLPPGKTIDALVSMPNADITIALFDRMRPFSNDSVTVGDSLFNLQVGTGSVPVTPPTVYAVDDAYAVVEDTQLVGAISVLDNDVGLAGAVVTLLQGTSNGSLVLNSNGEFDYTPNANFSGSDGFTYNAAINGDTYPAFVALNVSFENDSPVAAADGPYVNNIGPSIDIKAPGVLANDSDPDGDALTATIDGAAPAGLTLNSDGSLQYTGTSSSVSFAYRATDIHGVSSDPVNVSLKIMPVSNIALTVQDPDGVVLSDYRWVVEEEAMWQPDPSIIPPPVETLATNFHTSHMPVVAQGSGAVEFSQLALDPAKHYYVSVLPADAATGVGHTIGGARLYPGSTALTVNVNKQPLPYAQISIFVFEDIWPTNGAVDGNELGLGGFQITLEEAGGRYGISGGVLSQDANGDLLKNSLDCFGTSPPPEGVILTCPDTPENRDAGLVGEVLVKNLYPGKYGVIASPAAGGEAWTQTSTIEGTKVIDAWVKAGEPAVFREFGPGGWHAFIGFLNPNHLVLPPGGGNTVTGKVTNLHMSRPPNQQLVDSDSYAALSHTRAWVGLNSDGGIGRNIAAVQANEDGTFTINDVPDGNYNIVVWDSYLDQVIAFRGVTLNKGAGGDVGNIPVFQWFARSEHNVFLDENENGVFDAGESPIIEQAINLRWRDGTVNQSFPTDLEGFVPFDQTFPFFHWQVLEVDYTRFKATGLTVTVDAGGDVSTGPYPGILAPQQQGPCTQYDVDNNLNGCVSVGAAYTNPNQRTETGPVLTQGFQGFLGQTSIFDWGKAPYKPGENGGISGIVYYASTRAENDPRLAAGEPWEPGVPSVKIRLYREVETAAGGTALTLVQETETDSWDKSLPTGCPGAHATDVVITGGAADKCYDGLRNFNQARPAVFDGGYAFMDIPPGKYVVEMVPPPGYELLKEEDNNVAYGDVFANSPVATVLPNGAVVTPLVPDPATIEAAMAPEPGLAQPPCVGVEREVPAYLSLFPNEYAEAPFAGAMRPLCDRKEVILADQGQAAADFFLFTGTPIAGHFVGMILDDTAQEFSPYSPQFGEKWAPPFVPVSIRDYQNNEISRVYSDQWGRMNGLLPSTFTANMPSPSGFSPAMMVTCMNDPGPIIDTRPGSLTYGQSIVDPQYNPAYSNFCYTFQYMPGTTTYLDTPVLPVSAFASGYNPVDCSLDDGVPMIERVDGTGTGPWVTPGGSITITSLGTSYTVLNPAYEGPNGTGLAGQKTIQRDYGFGATQGHVTVDGVELAIASWNADTIVATAPNRALTGDLVVTHANGNSTEHSVTLTVNNSTPIRVSNGESIQAAIDAARPGSLILVDPGTYEEQIIMWKPVRLQGAGAGSTVINAANRTTVAIDVWRARMDCLFGIGTGCTREVDGLPNQDEGAGGFATEEGAAITVVGVYDSGQIPRPANSFSRRRNYSRIDGFSITGGDVGGGIYVNGYADNLEISNNHIFGNQGLYAGGIRVGRPFVNYTGVNLPFEFNKKINIHRNSIVQNGGLGGAGGGLSINTGSSQYRVTNNFICGNFTTGDGGGIAHFGLSDNGLIANNRILYNHSFFQQTSRSGGGLLIAGEPPIIGAMSLGTGDVTVDANLIQGNHAEAGHGGGIRTQLVNGQDVIDTVNANGQVVPINWHKLSITNNMIVNNVAGGAGGGISLQDTANSEIINNTVAYNDSTATISSALIGVNLSAKQPAGIVSEPHSLELNAAILPQRNTRNLRDFSNPILSNNIVWKNRAFNYNATLPTGAGLEPVLSQSTVGECAAGAFYWDLGVIGGVFALNPVNSILTDTTGYNKRRLNNSAADPMLVNAYCNGGRRLIGSPGVLSALPALDEGGATWIGVHFGPLTQAGPNSGRDYHVGATSPAINSGSSLNAPRHDYDNDVRPDITDMLYDIGADEH